MKAKFLLLLPLLLSMATASAQVPQILNYQGRISVGTTNFTGSGQFEFALVNSGGTTTYWSNDGTNGQPTNAVTLTVSNGLYSVLLGDTTIANMTTAIPYSVFTNPDVRLRVWFNDGTHGVLQLGPDQRLSAAGYALMAGGVDLPVTTSATSGTLELGGVPFLHAFGVQGTNDQNTFLGIGTGNFSLTGTQNTAVGAAALPANTTGNFNVAIGDIALHANTMGNNNTATGGGALTANTSGNYNVANGYNSLFRSNGNNNVAVGYASLTGNTGGSTNTALGYFAGSNLTTGSNNIDIGNVGVAGESNIIRIGDGNTQTATYLTGTIYGNGSGLTGITSSGLAAGSVTNTQLAANSVTATDIVSGAVGNTQLASGLTLGGTTNISGDLNLPKTTSASVGALEINGSPILHAYGQLVGAANIFVGTNSGNFTLTGQFNSALGGRTLTANTSGGSNLAVGYNALSNNTSGSDNTASGVNALPANTTGSNNTALGYQAGNNLTTGSNNIDIGSRGLAGESNIIRIGDGSTQTNTYLTGILGVGTGNALAAVGYPSNWLGLHYDSTGPVVGLFEGTSNARIHLRADSNTANVTQDFIIDNGNTSNQITFGWLGSGLANRLNTMTMDANGLVTIPGALTAGSSSSGVQFNGRLSINAASGTPSALTAQRFTSSEYAGVFLTESGNGIVTIGTSGSALSVNQSFGSVARADHSAYWDTSSDARIKHDIRNVTGALATLERLRPVRFHYNADFLAKSVGSVDYERFGVVAQEFQKVFPDFVDTDKEGLLSVRMDPIPIVTAAAVQELDAADKQRDATVANLQAENAALKKQVAQMQADDKDRDARLARLEKLLPTK